MAVQFTSSMQAHAEVLVSRRSRWCKGQRNSDGAPMFLFSSSRTDTEGRPIIHRTRADGGYCSCPSFEFRQACSHALAVRMAKEQADFDAESDALFSGYTKHEITAAPVVVAEPPARKGYADLFSLDGDDLCDAF